jgi:hypothetical protein
MASCTLRTHLKGHLSINLVVLVVILLLSGEKFLVCEEGVFMSVLGVPLEERLCSCPLDFLQAGVRRCPFEWRCALICRSSLMRHYLIESIWQLMGHDFLFPERILANPLPYGFDSGFRPHTFQAS